MIVDIGFAGEVRSTTRVRNQLDVVICGKYWWRTGHAEVVADYLEQRRCHGSTASRGGSTEWKMMLYEAGLICGVGVTWIVKVFSGTGAGWCSGY